MGLRSANGEVAEAVMAGGPGLAPARASGEVVGETGRARVRAVAGAGVAGKRNTHRFSSRACCSATKCDGDVAHTGLKGSFRG